MGIIKALGLDTKGTISVDLDNTWYYSGETVAGISSHAPLQRHDENSDDARDLGVVSNKRTAARAARQAGHAVASFDRHPWLEPFGQLWNLSPPRALSTTTERPEIPALLIVESRMDQACVNDAAIGAALRRLTWRRNARLQASASTQRLLLMKIKGLRLSGWARSLDARGCPHCVGLGAEGGWAYLPHHVALPHRLRCVGTTATFLVTPRQLARRNDQLAEFSRRGLQRSPPGHPGRRSPLRSGPGAPERSRCAPRSRPASLDAPSACWIPNHLVLAARHRGRGAPLDEVGRAICLQRAPPRCAPILSPHPGRRCPGRGPSPTPPQDVPAVSPPTTPVDSSTTDVFVLFFDGGSRGNPGPGGAGSIVIRSDRDRRFPQVVWSAATSLAAPTTTNNVVEYVGLLTGLKAALRAAWCPLEVVGDSLLILRQLEQYRPPKNLGSVTCASRLVVWQTSWASLGGIITPAPITKPRTLPPTSPWMAGAASSPSTPHPAPNGRALNLSSKVTSSSDWSPPHSVPMFFAY